MKLLEWLGGRRTARAEGLPEEGSPLLAASSSLDGERLLSSWRWLVRADFQPVLCTAAGDLFLQRGNGAVFWLDVGNGALRSVAPSGEALDEQAREPERFEEWFKPALVEAARRRTRALAPGECYSYALPPRLGGSASAENLAPRALAEHFDAIGRLFQAAAKR